MKSTDEDVTATVVTETAAVTSPKHRHVHFANAAYAADTPDPPKVAEPTTDDPTTPELSYDPYAYGDKHDPTSFAGTIFHVLILVVGSAVLTIPSLFVGVGYAVGLAVTPSLTYLYAYTCAMVVRCEYELCKRMRIPHLSYPDVVYHALLQGPPFCRPAAKYSRHLTYAVFVVVWFGYCCCAYVFIGQNLRAFTVFAFRVRVPTDTFLLGLVAPLTLLGLVSKRTYLVAFSTLANAFNGVSLLLIVYSVLTDPAPWTSPSAVGRLSNVPLLMGSILFNLNISGILMPLKNAMKEPKKFASCCGVLTLSFGVTCVVYTCFSLLCAMKYGAAVQPNAIANVPADRLLAQFGVLLLTLALFLQYPLVLSVPFDVIWHQNLKSYANSSYADVWKFFVRTGIVMTSFAAAITVPNIFLFISLSGTVGTSIDSLILPAVVHSVVVWRSCTSRMKLSLVLAKNMAIAVLAFILVVTGSRDCITQIADYYYGKRVGAT